MKTLVAASAVALGVFVIALFTTPPGFGIVRLPIVLVEWSVTLLTACVAMGALFALYRDQLRTDGRMDLFDALNEGRSEKTLANANRDLGIRLRRACRRILRGRWLLVGDIVEIRSLDEIRMTLDQSGCLDGLPFMPEMAKFCGRRALVFRCPDKIYDYGGSKTLRRVKDAVLLVGLRCDGSAHGGCQASCYLLWKTPWLRPVGNGQPAREAVRDPARAEWPESIPSAGRYICQYTQLVAASISMRKWDIRQDLRPALAGNVTLGAFAVAILTRLFNVVQAARRGAGYPGWGVATGQSVRSTARDLAPGDTVRVLAMEDIAPTLNEKGRNRGLWFDRDMIRHCGRRYTVLRKVERIIDDATGQMQELKTPCVVLDGAEASGEFLRFCAQAEYPFWREVWLSRELDGGRVRTGGSG